MASEIRLKIEQSFIRSLRRMVRAKFILLALLFATGCGLKLDDFETPRTNTPCTDIQKAFPPSNTWSPELLSALLQCSQRSSSGLNINPKSLQQTAQWLNKSFDSKSRFELIRFLQAVPPELGQTLQKFADAAKPEDQKYWPEWIRWTQAFTSNPKFRPDLLSEQLQILASVPEPSLRALVTFLEKLRTSPDKTRVDVLERLGKIYFDLSQDPKLQSFLSRGVAPLNCLKLEGGHIENSLIASGWILLLRSKNDPLKFGKTFVQSYGLLHNFCDDHQIPSTYQTYAALEYFIKNHQNVFLPILNITDNSSQALIPLFKLWSESKIYFTQTEFLSLLDTLNKILTMAHNANPNALSSYVRILSSWTRSQSSAEIQKNIDLFKKIPWGSFVIPTNVLDEWTEGTQKNGMPFLNTLAQYIEKDSHRKMAKLLEIIKIRTGESKQQLPSPLTSPPMTSIESQLLAFTRSDSRNPLPAAANFLNCLKTFSSQDLWSCLKLNKETIPFSDNFIAQEKANPLFFQMSNPEQPGRWLGQGFFGSNALQLWNQALKKLRNLRLPIETFVKTFPLDELNDDEKVKGTYRWLKNAPQTQPESDDLRMQLGIPYRIARSDFDDSVWLNWFDDPSQWSSVQKVLTDPSRSANIISGLKKLTQKRLRLRLYKSDSNGLNLTSYGEMGMLSALDILLWEVPYDWVRKWIIGKILCASSPADLDKVLRDSQTMLSQALWVLNTNPLTRHGQLWKKAANASAILNATIAMRVENELFNWSEVMKGLAGSLPLNDAKDFLVTLQKTGIISSISHLLHEKSPSAPRFASSLIEVFHVIRNSRAKSFAWYNAVFENQISHGLFVYQILALAEDALKRPENFYHIEQMNSLVRTGAQWVERDQRTIPLKSILDAITGPDSVMNPWIWVFLREIQDDRSAYHAPWMRLLKSLEDPAARDQVQTWIDSKIPEDIGSWMDAIIAHPNRF